MTLTAVRPLFRIGLVLRPMSPPLFAAASLVVLAAGAAYCRSYEGLRGGAAQWSWSLLWSACAVWPWLFAYEYVKRREWADEAILPARIVTLLLVLTAAASIALEAGTDWARAAPTAPLGLLLLRRLPAVGAVLLLLLLCRRERRLEMLKLPDAPGDEAEALRRHAAAIEWIRAADNYLELQIDGKVRMLRITMRNAAAILKPLGFVRIHRSFMVNRRHVRRVVTEKRGAMVEMADGASLPTGRAFSSNLRLLA